MFLMPSQFEPCGLSQLIALRYGCVPIVRETGGLKDTITPYNVFTDEGNGFSFANYNAHEMLFTIERALEYWTGDKEMWRRMMLRGMADRFDWQKPALAYLALYQKVLPLGKPNDAPEARCTEPATTAPVPEKVSEETEQVSVAEPAEAEPAEAEPAEAKITEEEPILEAATTAATKA